MRSLHHLPLAIILSIGWGYAQSPAPQVLPKQQYKVQVSDDPEKPKTAYWVIDPGAENKTMPQDNIRVIVRLKNEPLSTGRTRASVMATEHKKFLRDQSKISKRLSVSGVD